MSDADSYVIIATYDAAQGKGDELAAELEQMRGPTRAEPGCRSYDVYRSREDEHRFVLVEVYEDEAAFQAHCNADYFEEHIKQGAWSLLEDRSVVRAAPLP